MACYKCLDWLPIHAVIVLVELQSLCQIAHLYAERTLEAYNVLSAKELLVQARIVTGGTKRDRQSRANAGRQTGVSCPWKYLSLATLGKWCTLIFLLGGGALNVLSR
jgi:hypothetical protein